MRLVWMVVLGLVVGCERVPGDMMGEMGEGSDPPNPVGREDAGVREPLDGAPPEPVLADAAVPPVAPRGAVCDLATEYQVPARVDFHEFPIIGSSSFSFNADDNTAEACLDLLNGRQCYDERVGARMSVAHPDFPAQIRDGNNQVSLDFSYATIDGEFQPDYLYIWEQGAFTGALGNKQVVQLRLQSQIYRVWDLEARALSEERELRVERDANGFVYWAAPSDGPGEVFIEYQCVPKPPPDAGVLDGGIAEVDAGIEDPPCQAGVKFLSLASSPDFPGYAPSATVDYVNDSGQVCIMGRCSNGGLMSFQEAATQIATPDYVFHIEYTPARQIRRVWIFSNVVNPPARIVDLADLDTPAGVYDDYGLGHSGNGPVNRSDDGHTITFHRNGGGTLTLRTACR